MVLDLFYFLILNFVCFADTAMEFLESWNIFWFNVCFLSFVKTQLSEFVNIFIFKELIVYWFFSYILSLKANFGFFKKVEWISLLLLFPTIK